MKVAVVGNGNVGMAVFANLKNMVEIDELMLVGRSIPKISAEVSDYLDANVLDLHSSAKLSYGLYKDVGNAEIIIYTAGAGLKPGQDRLDMVNQNAEIVRSIFTEMKPYIQDAIVICISNPVDILTYVIKEVTGLPANKVMGSGTLLDSARLKRFISELFDIHSSSVDCLAIGEHGMSSVVLWSAVRIANHDIDSYAKMTISEHANMKKTVMNKYMKMCAYKLIDSKGSTAYGVANATARLVNAIVHDTKEIMPVSTTLLETYGITESCAMSVPCILGKNGILDVVNVNMDDDEKEQLLHSASIIGDIIKSL